MRQAKRRARHPRSRRSAQTVDFTEAIKLLPAVQAAQDRLEEIIPRLAEARRRYGATRSEEDRLEHDEVQAEVSARLAEFNAALERAKAATGLPSAVFDQFETVRRSGDRTDRRLRGALTAGAVTPTDCIDHHLQAALAALVARLPPGFLDDEDPEIFRLPETPVDRPVSIVKGIRPESEKSGGHRLRQMIQVAKDRLAQSPRYDHFAGAMLVPQLTSLGMRLEVLDTIPGAAKRIANLWKKPAEVDNIVYELLVAAGLAEFGRRPSFIAEGQGKSPDIRCEHPFPLVVECKRRGALNEYEVAEEAAMRAIFIRLRSEALRIGATGTFNLTLTVEASEVDGDAIIARCLERRLAPRPSRPLQYSWGSVSMDPLPRRIALPGPTKAYSPELLEFVFGWEADVAGADGIICQADTPEGVIVTEVRDPVALRWSNISQAVTDNRTRPPTSLFGKATKQMPSGEFGLVYICYPDGAREDVADRRVEQIAERLKEWEHSAAFRIPLVIISRLYPRALDGGAPDLIESAMWFQSEVSGFDPWMLEAYPSCVFTREPD